MNECVKRTRSRSDLRPAPEVSKATQEKSRDLKSVHELHGEDRDGSPSSGIYRNASDE